MRRELVELARDYCGTLDMERFEELLEYFSEWELRIIKSMIKDDILLKGEVDPICQVYWCVANQLPPSANWDIYCNYLDTKLYVRIPKEDFEELPKNIKEFLENECELTILEEDEN